MPRSLSIIASLCLVVLFTGCVTSSAKKTTGKTYQKTSPNSVKVYKSNPKRAFFVIGKVEVNRSPAGSDSVIERKFQTAAAGLGAQAVIIDQMPKATWMGQWTVTVKGKGRAIRWK